MKKRINIILLALGLTVCQFPLVITAEESINITENENVETLEYTDKPSEQMVAASSEKESEGSDQEEDDITIEAHENPDNDSYIDMEESHETIPMQEENSEHEENSKQEDVSKEKDPAVNEEDCIDETNAEDINVGSGQKTDTTSIYFDMINTSEETMSYGSDIGSYINEKKAEFENTLSSFIFEHGNVLFDDYSYLFGPDKYAVIEDITFEWYDYTYSKDAVVSGDIANWDECQILSGNVTRTTRYCIEYKEVKVYVSEQEISDNVISNITINVKPPKAGDVIKDPSVTPTDGEGYSITSSTWCTEDGTEIAYGDTFHEGNYYIKAALAADNDARWNISDEGTYENINIVINGGFLSGSDFFNSDNGSYAEILICISTEKEEVHETYENLFKVQIYDTSINPRTGGTVMAIINEPVKGSHALEKSPYGYKIPNDSDVTFTAVPSEGYHFKGWYQGDEAPKNGFPMDGFLSGDSSFYIAGNNVKSITNNTLFAVFEKDGSTDSKNHIHHLIKIYYREPTCTETGNIEYWECSECMKIFSDDKGEHEIADSDSIVIKPKGHKWGKWIISEEPTTSEPGIETRECENDHKHFETREIPPFAINYTNESGNESVFTHGNNETLRFTFKRSVNDKETMDHLIGLKINTVLIDSSNYEVMHDEKEVILLPVFLNKLPSQMHSMTAMFNDGNNVIVYFYVKDEASKSTDGNSVNTDESRSYGSSNIKTNAGVDKSTNDHNPATEDNTDILFYTLLMIISAATVIGTISTAKLRKCATN